LRAIPAAAMFLKGSICTFSLSSRALALLGQSNLQVIRSTQVLKNPVHILEGLLEMMPMPQKSESIHMVEQQIVAEREYAKHITELRRRREATPLRI